MSRLPLLLLPLLGGCMAIAHDETPFFGKHAEEAANPRRSSPAELVAARHAMMHMAATLLFQEVMPVVRNGGDVKSVGHATDGLELFGHSIAGLFPEGSLTPESKALPAIWENKADFEAKANAFGDAAARLGEIGAAGDTAGYAAQAKVVQGACAACHKLYRREDPHH